MWSKQHHNAIAKEIRELWPEEIIPDHTIYAVLRRDSNVQRGTLTTLALNLAKRFAEDNEGFDPIRFLDACTPNVVLWPISELWEG